MEDHVALAFETYLRDLQAIEEAKASASGGAWHDTSFEGDSAIGSQRLASYIASWRRPNELSVEGMSLRGSLLGISYKARAGVEQGALDDCWLLGALATVVSTHGLESILGPQEHAAWGAHIFRFFKGGEEIFVAVDDRLPCSSDRLPAFARCSDHLALWAPLAEKAYAKLHGSYDILSGGAEADALADLTGGPAWVDAPKGTDDLQRHLGLGGLAGLSFVDTALLHPTDAPADDKNEGATAPEFAVNLPLRVGAAPERLCFGRDESAASISRRFASVHGLPPDAEEQIETHVKQQRTAPLRCSMQATSRADATGRGGAIANHAYTVLGTDMDLYDAIDAVHLYNPWGMGVIASSACGVDEMRQPKEPGCCVVGFDAILGIFNAIHFCMPRNLVQRVACVRGTWSSQTNGGRSDLDTWSSNPQFLLHVSGAAADEELLLILRYAHEPRAEGRRSRFKALGMDVFRSQTGSITSPLESKQDLPTAAWSSFLAARQVCTTLAPGKGDSVFVVVPCQYERGTEAVFFLEVHAFRRSSVSVQLSELRVTNALLKRTGGTTTE